MPAYVQTKPHVVMEPELHGIRWVHLNPISGRHQPLATCHHVMYTPWCHRQHQNRLRQAQHLLRPATYTPNETAPSADFEAALGNLDDDYAIPTADYVISCNTHALDDTTAASADPGAARGVKCLRRPPH